MWNEPNRGISGLTIRSWRKSLEILRFWGLLLAYRKAPRWVFAWLPADFWGGNGVAERNDRSWHFRLWILNEWLVLYIAEANIWGKHVSGPLCWPMEQKWFFETALCSLCSSYVCNSGKHLFSRQVFTQLAYDAKADLSFIHFLIILIDLMNL